MATQKETTAFILDTLGNDKRFHTRAMFGEYALYVDTKVVALICDDQLYVKILPASAALEEVCEKEPPYKGARPHYRIDMDEILSLEGLSEILFGIADSLPEKKVKKAK